MARQIEDSLDYFPFDVDFFDEPKILLVEEEHGMKGGYVAVKLLCWIYRESYFVKWSREISVVFARRIGHQTTSDQVNAIVESMLKYSLFSQKLFDEFGILTSRGIQRRWQKIITLSKRKAVILKIHDLINSVESELIPENPLKTGSERITSEFKDPIPELIPQRKVKESKGKESKRKIKEKAFNPLDQELPFVSDKFKELWISWVEHRKQKGSALTKNATEAQLAKLGLLAESIALATLSKAIENNWSGMYALKPWEVEEINKAEKIKNSDPVERKAVW